MLRYVSNILGSVSISQYQIPSIILIKLNFTLTVLIIGELCNIFKKYDILITQTKQRHIHNKTQLHYTPANEEVYRYDFL